MQRQVSTPSAAGVGRQAVLFGYPDECPRCHRRLVPKLLASVGCGADSLSEVEEAFQCTNRDCERVFVATYRLRDRDRNPPQFEFGRSQPVAPADPLAPDTVTDMSPSFYETYKQALAAEAHGLNQLTGIGLRKALEFLVKDFAIRLDASKAEAVRKKPLAACIEEHIDDSNLKATAKRAAWLGNDETHYVRRWEDRDISDLKVLIRLAMNWADNVLLTLKYTAEMPEGKQ